MDDALDSEKCTAALRELLAEREIARLHARYAHLCDSGYPADEIADLFVEQGLWQSDPGGRVFRGRDQIRDHFGTASAGYPWALHVNALLHIDVSPDGLSARGAWYLLMPCVDATVAAPTAAWLAGRYDNTFVKTDAGWRYQHLHIRFGLMSPHSADWAQERHALAGAATGTEEIG
ncbi:SnoaL-like domain-containing protein [Mycolicibacterium neoaurum]|uniref:nuclear transport factor 2 family protein n=1 Tax=Mycolicibacterium neoaurum TaxID=1795 RepID=UPI00068E8F41|nr:nuclear transport factor 2 family protein [Mycolicibacterium neoaurum]SDD12276.1 SnoaL-like domain-containing protein [Mycolicibacterium neoaurum]